MSETQMDALPPGLSFARSASLTLGLTWLVLLAIDWVVMPYWGEFAGGLGSPVPRAREVLESVRWLSAWAWGAALCAFWSLLYLHAARAGGPVYATGHVALSVLLTPLALVGIAVIPLIVMREIVDGTAAHRRATMRLGWLDVVVVGGVGGALLLWYLA